MDPIQMLTEIEKIKGLKGRYCRAMDTRDWDGLASLFIPDAKMIIGDATTAGARAIAEWISGRNSSGTEDSSCRSHTDRPPHWSSLGLGQLGCNLHPQWRDGGIWVVRRRVCP